MKQRVESIDVAKFLEDIVCNYRRVEDPAAFLEWVATVSVFILDQLEFKNCTDMIQ